MQRLSVRLAMASLLGVVASCATAPQPTVLSGEGLGSTWSVKLGERPSLDLATVQSGIEGSVDEVARQLSRWDAASALSVLNASGSSEWQGVSDGISEPLSYALTLAADTGGAYDPTVAALVDVWGFGKAGRRYEPPAADAIKAAREGVGFAKVALDGAGKRVRKPSGMQIDLSSMTHGRGADRVAEYLNSIGVRSYLVDVGSEIRARGESPAGGAWHVAIERPPSEVVNGEGAGKRQNGLGLAGAAGSQKSGDRIASGTAASADSAAGDSVSADSAAADSTSANSVAAGSASGASMFERVVSLRDAAIATSGNYQYFFDYNGRRYSHRIDPRTGEPITHPLASVTVIDPVCMHADALATALTVLGPDEGMRYAMDRNIAALFIVRSGDALIEKMTPQFAAYLN